MADEIVPAVQHGLLLTRTAVSAMLHPITDQSQQQKNARRTDIKLITVYNTVL